VTNPVVTRLVDTLASRDRQSLVAVLASDVRLRALLPRRSVDVTGPAGVADEMLGWFDDVPEIVPVHRTVDAVGDVWHAGYRFALRGLVPERVVDQQAYCTVHDGAVSHIRLACSGFRPVRAVPEPAQRMDALGDGCATLTPRIAAALRQLAPGDVLAVLTDDPSASDGIAAWSRLTGHAVVGTEAEAAGTRYYLRHA
jgi:TusA-related sulfurtransferase